MSLRSRLGIQKKRDLAGLVRQFFKFGVVGVSNTAISLGVYYLFIFINPEYYIAGNAAGFAVSVLNAYFWNNRYVFRKREKGHAKPLLKTFIAYGLTFLIGAGLLYTLVEYAGVSKSLAPLLILFVTIPLNFLLNKFWAFR